MPSSPSDQSRQPSLVVILLGLLPLRLVRSLLFNHRLFVGLICLCLFPVFIFTTLVSSLLGLVINHMAHNHSSHNRSASSSRRATPVSASPTSPSSQMDDDNNSNRSYDHDDMDYWLQRCSICFEAQLDLCLDYCRDQYCLECFSRYVTEVVTSSWGLSVTKIRCPVCQDPIPQSEWSKFVPKSVVDHYNRFNQPYRSYSRCCPHCDTEVSPCDYHHCRDDLHQPKSVHNTLKDLLQNCNMDEHHEDPRHSTIQRLLPLFERQDWNSQTLIEVYHRTIIALKAFENHVPLRNLAWTVSKQILTFDMKPDTWRRLQFAHITYFPVIDCPSCHLPFCLQCGNEEHEGVTCEEYMQGVVDQRCAAPEVIETFRWQLKNSRKCPNCSIMINRDEGCNKVDCSFCGFCFCWACRSPWSEKCGFYHCAEAAASELSPNGPEVSGANTELGVPNVSSIQARLFPSINV